MDSRHALGMCPHTSDSLLGVRFSFFFFYTFFFARCSHLSERERDAITGSRLVCASVSAFFFHLNSPGGVKFRYIGTRLRLCVVDYRLILPYARILHGLDFLLSYYVLASFIGNIATVAEGWSQPENGQNENLY